MGETMLKNIQTKIVLIFLIAGTIMILGLGAVFIYTLEKVNTAVATDTVQTAKQVSDIIYANVGQMKLFIAIAVVVFALISILIGIFLSKGVISPISKLIKSAEKVANGEDVEIRPFVEGKKKSEVDELANTLGSMTNELRRNLNEVSKQKRQIETILLHMADGVMAFNMEGEVILKNPAATRLLNISPEDNDYHTIFQKLDLDTNMEKVIYLENWTSTEQRVQVEDRFLNLFFAPFKDENDRPAGVIVVAQDITEHVKLDNMRKEFVADVSHELKTPITSIMGYADTLLEGEYDKETKERFLGVIAQEGRRMARLVNDLLTLSRYDTKTVKTEKTEFDLGELVKSCQEKLELEIMKKHHYVECFVTAFVYADRYGIERVVLNILSNSIKYTPEEGKIKIYVGFVYNDAYIKIIDNGIGIPEKDLSRIFDRFYRVDKARTREMGGTGLGLSIAKEILDQNAGSIDIKSNQGKGTEVVIRIPTKGPNSKKEVGEKKNEVKKDV